MSSENYQQVLVRLTGISQELTVGVGAAIASVRTLTDFSLVVHARELIVLSGSSGAGERAVLAVIAGDRRGVSGTREVHNNVRLRSLRISASSALALAQEWQMAELESMAEGNASQGVTTARENAFANAQSSPHPADVFLLDVVDEPRDSELSDASRSPAKRMHWRSVASASSRRTTSRNAPPAAWSEKNRAALYNWAVMCRRRGGAIAMAASEQFGLHLINAGLARPQTASADERIVARDAIQSPDRPFTERSRATSTYASASTSAVRETPVYLPSMRVVAMHCGRLAATIPIPMPGQPQST